MSPSEYRSLLEKAWPKQKRILAVGPPGVGKTFIKKQACQAIGFDLLSLSMAVIDVPYLLGYPFRDNGTASHAPFGTLAKALEASRPTVLDLDEFGAASESVQKAALRLIQFGEVGGRRLPDCVVISASTNDVGHGAGVQGMIEPLKSRFHAIIEVKSDLEDLIGYGLARNWPTWLCAFLRQAPDAIHDWKPEKSMKVGGACPRGWEYVAEWDNDGFDDPEVWSGVVGKGRATQAHAFKQLINELPDVDAVLMDPDNAPVPSNPSAIYLVSMALAGKMTAANFGSCVKYLNRLPAMFRAFSIRDGFRAEEQKRKDGRLPKDHRAIQTSRDFTAWAVSDDGKNVMSAAS